MSEPKHGPFDTDELIARLNIHFYPSPTGNSGDDYRLAIIAKLRAGDRLCEVAKRAVDEWWRITNEAVLAITTIKMRDYDCFISDQYKAIAEYEGEE